MMEPQLGKIIMLGFAFMLIFTTFQSSSLIEQVVLESVSNSTGFGVGTHAGYYSLSTIYLVFTFANFLAPSVVLFCGARWSMVLASVTYVLLVASFLILRPWLLYVSSVLNGLGASLMWTGQGNYLTLASDSDTIGRNSGIAWALFQFSTLFGSIFLYAEFRSTDDNEEISDKLRYTVYGVLTGIGVLGIISLSLLRSPKPDSDSVFHLHLDNHTEILPEKQSEVGVLRKAVNDFVATFAMLARIDMLLLAVTMFCSGIELTFWSGVYGTSVANTKALGRNAHSLLGINGMLLAAGEITGGLAFGIFGNRTARYSRIPIVLLGLLVHLTAFACSFVNLPAHSPLGVTTAGSYLTPNVYLAMACSFMLGLGDSCWNTQLYSILGVLYPGDDSAQAFALFRFFQSLAASIGFFYSTELQLHWQLLILSVFSVLGCATFCVVELKVHSRRRYI